MKGLSARNPKYIRALAEAHRNTEFAQQVVARLPWGHVADYGDRERPNSTRMGTIGKRFSTAGGRNERVHQIESNLYERQGKALTNFFRERNFRQSLPYLRSSGSETRACVRGESRPKRLIIAS
jgi:hypothetical protein